MHRKRNLKLTLGVLSLAIAASWAPGAHAAAEVCNEARKGHSGQYDATDNDRNPPARFKEDLKPIGSTDGLVHASTRSPALSVCVATISGGGGGGGDTGGGDTGGGDTGGGDTGGGDTGGGDPPGGIS